MGVRDHRAGRGLMPFYDVTVPLRTGMPVFEGDTPVRIEVVASMAAGAICNLSQIDGSLHAGTHIDAPCHFIAGAGGVETLPIEAMIGPCVLADARHVRGLITAADVAALVPPKTERVLFRTANGGLWDRDSFSREYVALAEDAAYELVRRGVRLVAIDYLSVAPFEDPAPVHIALLEAGVVVLEGLDLRAAPPGTYDMMCLPLLVPGADGAPARVVLRG